MGIADVSTVIVGHFSRFRTTESARKFAGLLESDADRSDELTARTACKKETASSRLIELAHDLETRAEETLSQDRLTNMFLIHAISGTRESMIQKNYSAWSHACNALKLWLPEAWTAMRNRTWSEVK